MPRSANIDPAALTQYISDNFGNEFGSQAVLKAADEFGVSYPTICKRLDQYKVGYGKWSLTAQEIEATFKAPAAEPAVELNLIPQKDDSFVQFGDFSDIKKIIKSRLFYPAFITGLSGNGKTFGVEQASAPNSDVN